MPRLLHLLIGVFAMFFAAGDSVSDVRTTPHALVKSQRPDASDICVYCHTPNTKGVPPEKAPQWQSSIDKNLEFVIYDDIGRLGLGKTSVGSQSMACLSCHDANQARTMIGKADHPFGVPYRGATKLLSPLQASQAAHRARSEDAPSKAAVALEYLDDFRDPSRSTVEGRTVWWVSTTGIGARRSRSDLPLYSRMNQEGDLDVPYIECSSCHDPHSNNEMFLRIPNSGSKLCLSCHIK